ncbi:MAG: hypothetical protein EP343_23035 [Deltaproteobacteria bacterium]|nr:MAG: hypothetical protein EP343_23035 [Deltaproteobacteria bacterium]
MLSPGVAFGTLRAYTNASLATATLGLREIALLQEVPNDINFVGGIISSQFQSTLSHINVLSRNRGTPHLVIREPMKHPDVAKLRNKMVRLPESERRRLLPSGSHPTRSRSVLGAERSPTQTVRSSPKPRTTRPG